MAYESRTLGAIATKRAQHMGARPFPFAVISVFAVDEFVALTSAGERTAWAAAHGVSRPMTHNFLEAVRRLHRSRVENRRLGLST